MPQHNFSEPDESGAAYRAGINDALQALATLSSGAAAPSTTYARQFWADTTTNLLKRRNAANSAWIPVLSLDETFVVARSSNTILGQSDFGKTVVATSSFTQTLTAAATLGDGWNVNYFNNNGVTGGSLTNVTIDPNGAETIDGAATFVLPPQHGITIYCDGSAFYTVGYSYTGISSGVNWNPDLRFGGANTGITYTSRQGNFAIAGGLAFISFSFVLSSKGSASGAATLANAPPMPSFGNVVKGFGCVASNWANMLTSVTPGLQCASGSSTYALTNQAAGTSIANLANTDFNNNSELEMSFVAQLL